MFSKLLELTGLSLIAWGLAWAISVPAGLIFGGTAIVFIGSVTDDASVGMALRRGTSWIRYAWWRQIAKESGLSVPDLNAPMAYVACGCGGDEECPVCDGVGYVPDPAFRVNPKSPHPPLHVDADAREFYSRAAQSHQARERLRATRNGDRERIA
jgi:hypothetical protein